MRNALQMLSRDSAIYLFGTMILSGASAFLLIPILVRYLSPEEYGIITIVSVITTFVMISSTLGMNSSIEYEYHNLGPNSNEFREHLGTIFLFTCIVSVVIAIVVFISRPIFEMAFPSFPFYPFIIGASLIGSSAAVILMLTSTYRIQGKPIRYVSVALMQFFLSVAAVLIFVVYFDLGAEGKVIGDIIAGIILFIIALLLISRESIVGIKIQNLNSALSFSIPLLPHFYFAWVLMSADRLIIGKMLDLESAGIYSLGYQFGMVMFLTLNSIDSGWIPVFYETANKNDELNRTFLARATEFYFACVSSGSILMALIAAAAFPFIAVEEFELAVTVIPIVILGFSFLGFYYMGVKHLLFKRKTGLISILTIISGLLNILLNLMLIPILGIEGAGVATAVSYLFQSVIVWYFAQRNFHIPVLNTRLFSSSIFMLAGLLLIYNDPFLASNAYYSFIPLIIATALIPGRFSRMAESFSATQVSNVEIETNI